VVQIGLCLFQALETLTLQRRLLCMADTTFDFALAQSCQLHMILSIRSKFESFIPSIRFAASPFGSSCPRCSGARIG
jgi:hypothetical protein